MVYVLNAKYWAGSSEYFELTRAPLIPVIILLFSPLGWVTAEYLFIISASLFFLFSTVRLSDSLKMDKNLFYLFSLSPYVLFYGLLTGAELLSFSLVQLFISSLIQKKSYSGLFLGLACLVRYNFFIFVPLVLFNKNIEKIFKSLIFFAIPFIPWFAYNFFLTSNFFTSIADSYALNVKFRYHYLDVTPVNYSHIVSVISILLPLFILGLFVLFLRWKENNFSFSFAMKEKGTLIMVIILFLSLYQYYKIPLKIIRYIFPLVLPVSYFSVIGAIRIRKKSETLFKLLAITIIIINSFTTFSLIFSSSFETREKYVDALDKMEELSIENCRTLSNGWPMMNYFGKTTEPFPKKQLIEKNMEEGNLILLFSGISEPLWSTNKTFLHEYPVVFENEDSILIGYPQDCNPSRKFNQTYLSSLQENIILLNDYSININPCFVIFENKPVLEKFCNFINFQGFNLDSNRQAD